MVFYPLPGAQRGVLKFCDPPSSIAARAMLLLLALTASEALVAGPCALHAHSGLSVAARSTPAVAQFGLFNKGDDSASTKAKKGKQVKKAVKKSFLPFQKAPEPEPEPESPLEALKSLSGVAFLLSVPGAAATIVALIILVGNGKPPDSTPFEFLNGFYPPAVEKKKVVKAKNDAIEKQKKAEKAAAEKKAAEAKAAEEAAAEEAAKKKAAEEEAAKKGGKAPAKAPAAAAAPAAAPAAPAPAPPPPPAPASAPPPPAPKPAAKPAAKKADAAPEAKKAAVPSHHPLTTPSPHPLIATLSPPSYHALTTLSPRSYHALTIYALQDQAPAVVDKAMAGKPGFNNLGQPSSPGELHCALAPHACSPHR